MKSSYLLNCLVATLREGLKTIANSSHDVFVTELINDNFYNIRNGLSDITRKDDEDRFVTKHYSDLCYALKMDFYAKKTRNLSKVQYIALWRKVIDQVIDNAAREGYAIDNDADAAEPEATPAPPAADETPGDEKTPSQSSEIDFNKVVKLLKNIDNNMQKLIQIFEKYKK